MSGLIVYIASPFAGDIGHNVVNARNFCRHVIAQGFIPFAPHLLYPQFMDDGDEAERDLGIQFGLALLAKCDELWVFGETVSDGMFREITEASRLGLPIRRVRKVETDASF
jgi:hypothetical protein